tara:strand:+ start:234 stop:377 length:144 start_codon:yes stop_codon:yes gene_type:complete
MSKEKQAPIKSDYPKGMVNPKALCSGYNKGTYSKTSGVKEIRYTDFN